MTVRRALTGLAVGLLVGTIATAVAWKLRQGSIRPYMAGAGLIGLLAGGVVALRRRWSDTEVALYLDGRWDSNEAITTAIELRKGAENNESARAVVVEKAASALANGNPKKARPSMFSVYHALIPMGAAGVIGLSMMDLPPMPEVAPEPGSDFVKVADVEALERVANLGRLKTPDLEQQQRLKKIAEEAKKLKKKLAKGMERRDAQHEIARLRDAVAAERARMGSAEQRAGLEAAHGRLAKESMLKKAAKALGDRDLTKFDLEMQKLANQLEKRDREAAKKALEEAAKEARNHGARDVAKMLEEQKKLFEERSRRGEALREFADAFGDDLPPELKEQLEDLKQGGNDADTGRLAERMADALKSLTPEERKRLAERIRERMKDNDGGFGSMSKEQMDNMLDSLDSPDAQKQLEEMLRQMADEPPKSGEAERDRMLGEVEKGLGETEQGLGARPVPIPGAEKAGEPFQKPDHPSHSGSNPKGDGNGTPGSHHDTGRGDHDGNTNKVDGDGFRSRAGGKLNPGAPMPGVVTGRGKGKVGDSANVRGIQGIGEAAPGEIGGVERSEIPEEYREQIGRYFSP